MKRRLCAAAVCAAFGAGAMWSAAAPAQSALERAQSMGVLAGLDRAMKTPLEIVWLRAASDEALWKQAEFSGTKPIGRTAWRYVFGGSAQYAPPPNEVARLVVSTLKLPQGSLAAGRLDLRGSGRLYIVTPETAENHAAAPDKVAMILAAGSTLTVSDALSPAIHVELKAPDAEPLLLGNLAASDLRKALALLVKPAAAGALEASVKRDGKVALQGSGAMQLAALLPSSDLPVQLAKTPAPEAFMTALASPTIAPALPAPRRAAGPVAPDVARDFVAFAAVPQIPQAQFEPVALAALPSFEAPQARAAGTASPTTPMLDVPVDVAAVSVDVPRKETITLAALAVTAFPHPVVAASSGKPGPAPQSSVSVPVEAGMTASRSEPMSLAVLTPATFDSTGVPVRNSAAPRTEAKAQFAVDVRVAMAAPIAGSLEFKAPVKTEAPAAQKADLAQMRAEIEAEIARERDRLAAQFKPQVIGAPTKRFVLGV